MTLRQFKQILIIERIECDVKTGWPNYHWPNVKFYRSFGKFSVFFAHIYLSTNKQMAKYMPHLIIDNMIQDKIIIECSWENWEKSKFEPKLTEADPGDRVRHQSASNSNSHAEKQLLSPTKTHETLIYVYKYICCIVYIHLIHIYIILRDSIELVFASGVLASREMGVYVRMGKHRSMWSTIKLIIVSISRDRRRLSHISRETRVRHKLKHSQWSYKAEFIMYNKYTFPVERLIINNTTAEMPKCARVFIFFYSDERSRSGPIVSETTLVNDKMNWAGFSHRRQSE